MRSSRVQNIDFVVTVDREFVRPVRVIETSNPGPNPSGSRPPVLRLRHTRFFFPSWFFETYGRKTAECRTRRTPEKCVLFLRFENLFLGGLLAFRYSVVLRRIKTLFSILNVPSILPVRRSGVKKQNVLSQPRLGDNNTDFHVTCTSKSDTCFVIRGTCVVLVMWRVQKNDFFITYIWMWYTPITTWVFSLSFIWTSPRTQGCHTEGTYMTSAVVSWNPCRGRQFPRTCHELFFQKKNQKQWFFPSFRLFPLSWIKKLFPNKTEKTKNVKCGNQTPYVVYTSGEGHKGGTDVVKGLPYTSCRNEISISLDKYAHGRHSRKCGDKQNMSALCLEVLLQTKPLPVTPGGGWWREKYLAPVSVSWESSDVEMTLPNTLSLESTKKNTLPWIQIITLLCTWHHLSYKVLVDFECRGVFNSVIPVGDCVKRMLQNDHKDFGRRGLA